MDTVTPVTSRNRPYMLRRSGERNTHPPKGVGVLRHSPNSIAERIDDISHRLERLVPCHRNPHKFHEEKSELIHELRKLKDIKHV